MCPRGIRGNDLHYFLLQSIGICHGFGSLISADLTDPLVFCFQLFSLEEGKQASAGHAQLLCLPLSGREAKDRCVKSSVSPPTLSADARSQHQDSKWVTDVGLAREGPHTFTLYSVVVIRLPAVFVLMKTSSGFSWQKQKRSG